MYSIVPCAASEHGEGAAFHRRPRPQCWSYGARLWGLGVPHLPGRVPENQVGEALHLEAPQRKERVLRAARSPVQEPGMEWKSGELRCNQEHRAGGPGLPPSPPTPTALQGTATNQAAPFPCNPFPIKNIPSPRTRRVTGFVWSCLQISGSRVSYARTERNMMCER